MGASACLPTPQNVAASSNADEQKVSLDGEYKKYKLIKKTQYNHDCIVFRFALETSETVLGLPVGNHVMVKYEEDDKEQSLPAIMRAYTPISSDSDVGYFELLIKIYSDGALTSKLQQLQTDQYIDVKGPLGLIHYSQPGELKVKTGADRHRLLSAKKIGMLAGGSGITPVFQILNHIQGNKASDGTQVSLIFSNKSDRDILLREELEEMSKNNENIKIYFTLTEAGKDDNEQDIKGPQNMMRGYIDQAKIEKYIYPPSDDVVVMFCGPIAFNKAMKKALNVIGYPSTNVLKF